MIKQDQKEAFITLLTFTGIAVIFSLILQSMEFYTAAMGPVFLSWATLRWSDNKSDTLKIMFWWPFYLPVNK